MVFIYVGGHGGPPDLLFEVCLVVSIASMVILVVCNHASMRATREGEAHEVEGRDGVARYMAAWPWNRDGTVIASTICTVVLANWWGQGVHAPSS